jgi:hypothetical protein
MPHGNERYYDHCPMARGRPKRQSGPCERKLARPWTRRGSVAPPARLLPGALRPGGCGWLGVGFESWRTKVLGQRGLVRRRRHDCRGARIRGRGVRDPREPVPEPRGGDDAVGLAEPRTRRRTGSHQHIGSQQHHEHGQQHHHRARRRRAGHGSGRDSTVDERERGSRERRHKLDRTGDGCHDHHHHHRRPWGRVRPRWARRAERSRTVADGAGRHYHHHRRPWWWVRFRIGVLRRFGVRRRLRRHRSPRLTVVGRHPNVTRDRTGAHSPRAPLGCGP